MVDNTQHIFFSDFNCPFCYALNERIVQMGISDRIEWRGIEHLPAADSADDSWEEQTRLVNEVSIVRKRAPEVHLEAPLFRPSSGPANNLLRAFGNTDAEKTAQLRTLVYRAYWRDGEDISDGMVLRRLTAEAGLVFPEQTFAAEDPVLEEWQKEWEGELFKGRLPVLFSKRIGKPLLGFPTYDLLYDFFSGTNLSMFPESMAVCELQPKQVIMLVGSAIDERCVVRELEAAYRIVRFATLADFGNWAEENECAPDLILLDIGEFGEEGLRCLQQFRGKYPHRQTALIALLGDADSGLELDCFDSGATDVMFDLSDAKVCQARLEIHLRMRRNLALLNSMAQLDYLTELPNRREFDAHIEQEWRRASRLQNELSLLMIDIDHFKNYNDTYGHAMGDDCLRVVAHSLQASSDRPADMTARYGGEEFAVILPDTSLAGAKIVAKDICNAVSRLNIPHKASSVAEFVTVSIGVASLIPEAKQTSAQLIECADEALYRAKRNGRNRVED